MNDKILKRKRNNKILFHQKKPMGHISERFCMIVETHINSFEEKRYMTITKSNMLYTKKRDDLEMKLLKELEVIEYSLTYIDLKYFYQNAKALVFDISTLSRFIKKYYMYLHYNKIKGEPRKKSNLELFHKTYYKIKPIYIKLIAHLLEKAKMRYKLSFLEVEEVAKSTYFSNLCLRTINLDDVIKIKAKIEEDKESNIIIDKIKNINFDINNIQSGYEARRTKRHFVIHSGATNSGKTYDAIQDLMYHESGCYLGPLRLLALEIHDKLNNNSIKCNLFTGEEEITYENAKHDSSTIERSDLDKEYDLVVIDECQMINNEQRGGHWTKAILGMRAKKIHICTAPSAESLIIKLIELCDDTYEVIHHQRTSELVFEKEEYTSLKDTKPGDALITFNRVSVLNIAKKLKDLGVKVSVLYGNLPYKTRIEQFRMFREGETEVIVSTDAIGMGVNLPIKRVIFMSFMKYNGTKVEKIEQELVKQIAGRAGRRGIYDVGYVNALHGRKYIGEMLQTPYSKITKAKLSIPEKIIDLDSDIIDTIEVWNNIKTNSDFIEKCDTKYIINLLKEIKNLCPLVYDDKQRKGEVMKAAKLIVDTKEERVLELYRDYVYDYFIAELPPEPPEISEYNFDELEDLEAYYKSLELYHSFNRVFTLEYDREAILSEKSYIASLITQKIGNEINLEELMEVENMNIKNLN